MVGGGAAVVGGGGAVVGGGAAVVGGAVVVGFAVVVLPEIDSTNTELMRRARAGRLEPVLLVAEHQTAGRGRMGRQWTSGAGRSVGAALPALTF